MRARTCILLCLPLCLLGLSCSDDTPANTEPGPDFIFGTARSHFIPLAPGVKIVLSGTRTIINQQDSVISKDPMELHFTIEDRTLRSETGWTVSIMSVEYHFTNPADTVSGYAYVRSTADTVYFYNRYLREEWTTVFLKTPFQVGEAWRYGNFLAKIESVSEVVMAPAGLFSQVVRVSYEYAGTNVNDVFFSKGNGIVRWREKSNYMGDRLIIDVLLKSKNF